MADALISPAVGLGFAAVSGGLLAYACRRVVREEGYDRRLPLMGVLGAFVFAAMMINFAIPGTGSSGHIGGGLLLAVLVGPWAAYLIMASVLTVQCLLFADGGLLALGCNLFNLGFWPVFIGLPLYRMLEGRNRTLAAVVGVCASLLPGAFGVVAQTLLSGRSELPFTTFAAIMLGIHLPIALVEGFLTAGAVAAVRRLAPESADDAVSGGRRARVVIPILGAALLLGCIGAWFASPAPDGLEWSIARITGSTELPGSGGGIAGKAAQVQETTAVLPDYGFPKVGATTEAAATWPAVDAGTSVSGLVGAAAVVLLVALLLGLTVFLRRRSARA